MNNQENRERQNADPKASSPDTDVTRTQNRQAVADESHHPADNSNLPEGGKTSTNSHTGQHKEGAYDKESDKPSMDPGKVE